MRILFLNHNVRGAGTYLRAFALSRELVARGHTVTLVTTSAAERIAVRSHVVAGVQVVEAPDLLWGRGRTGWDPWNILRRQQALRGLTFDVIHAFDSRPAVIHPALAAQRWCGAPLFMDWADWWGRGGWINDRSGWAVRTLFGPIETWYEEHFRTSATGTTAISRALAQRAIDLGVTRTTVMWLPNGCTPAGQRPTRKAARERLGLAGNQKILLHVGVLTPGDYSFLRNAFEQAHNSRSDLRLVLAGRTGIRIMPKEHVLVTGAVPESALHDWVAAADACVIPCRKTIGNMGRWPSKVNEYMSAGRAVVMPRVGDVGTMVEEAEAGWVTEATPGAFADGMVRAVSDEAGRQIAGVRARTLAETTLAWSRLTDHLLSFYQRLTNGEATAPTFSAAGAAQ